MRKSIIALCLAGILLLTGGSALAQSPAGGFPQTIQAEDGKALGVRSQCAYQGSLLLLTDQGGLVAHEPASGTNQALLPDGSLNQVSWLLSEGTASGAIQMDPASCCPSAYKAACCLLKRTRPSPWPARARRTLWMNTACPSTCSSMPAGCMPCTGPRA